MPAALENITQYLPNLVTLHSADSSFPERSDEEKFHAIALFADITGFTPLAEKLAQRGPQGVESLSKLLNDYFKNLTDKVMEHGGDVVNLAGDGLLAIWKANDTNELNNLSQLAAQCAFAAQKELHNFKTSTGEILTMRIGIGMGSTRAIYIKTANNEWEYFFEGSSIEDAHQAENFASPGGIIVSKNIHENISGKSDEFKTKILDSDSNFFHLTSTPTLNIPISIEKPSVDEDKGRALQGFLPLTVMTRINAGLTNWMAELRRVGVLFINLKSVDSDTPLEQISQTIQAIHEIVRRYEGTINKIAMDEKGISPVVIFGLPPFVHEDNSTRAIMAAQDISNKLNEMGRQHGIGLTTGTVFSGAIGSDRRREYMVIGDCVNTSARLMQAALSNQDGTPILCDMATQQAVSSRINLKSLEPIKVKGKNEPLIVFMPVDNLPQPQTAVRTAGFIGRADEMQILRDAFSSLSTGKLQRTVIIEGEAGIGKSRLLENFQAELKNAGIKVHTSETNAIEKNTSYFGWRSVMNELFNLETIRDVEKRQSAILSQLTEQWRDRAALLNPILSVDFDEPQLIQDMSAEVRAENTRALMLELLQSAAGRETLCITMEDAHWLDSASWALVADVALNVSPLIMLISTRPRVDRNPPEQRKLIADANTTHLVLGPLNKVDTIELIKRRLNAESMPNNISELIWDKADGNPFFSEELAYSLRDSNLITISNGECRIVEGVDLNKFAFPNTVQGIVSSRIDRLPPHEQLCIKVASVIGRIFTYRILYDIHPMRVQEEQLRSYLVELEKLDLTPLETPDPELAYIFKHAITQDVAYNLMLFSQRQELHKAIAEWYEKNFADDVSPMYTILAHHWQNAGDAKKALQYLEAAAEQALESFANHEAISILETIIEMDSQEDIADDFQKASWQRQIGQAHKGVGDLETSKIHLKNALRLMGYPMPNNAAGWIIDLLGQFLKRVFIPIKTLDPDSDEVTRVREADLAYEQLSEIFFFASDLPPFLASLLRRLNLTDKIGPSPAMSRTRGAATTVAGLIPLHAIAKRYEASSRKLVDQLGQFEGLAYTMFSISLYNLGIGNFEQAKVDMERAVESVTVLNNRPRMAEVYTVLAQVYQRLFMFDKSMEYFEKAYQVGLRGENPQHQVWGMNGKAGILLYQGGENHAKEAIDLLTRSVPMLADSTDHTEDIRAYGMLGIAYLRNDQPDKAREAADIGLGFIATNSPTAHDAMEGYGGVVETYLTLLESDPNSKELSKLANKALKGLLKCGNLFPMIMPRYQFCRAWYERIQNKTGTAQKLIEKGLEGARKFKLEYEEARLLLERGRISGEETDILKAAGIFKEIGCNFELEQIQR